MKNKTLLVCAGFLLLIFLTFGTYAWYIYFLRISAVNTISNNTNISYTVGDIEFKENGDPVYDADAKSIEDIEVTSVPSYDFQVINNGNSSGKYTLYIEDIPVHLVEDGCTEDTLLKREDLKYQLTLNGTIIKEDYLSNIQDNILDSRTIETKKTNSYSLKVYIHDKAKDWFSKHYHYKVVLK